MNITLYHLATPYALRRTPQSIEKDTAFAKMSLGSVPADISLIDYKRVAEFEKQGTHKGVLEEVFVESQNIDSSWKPGQRSTSVGDIVRVEDDYYLCEGMGWACVTGMPILKAINPSINSSL